MSLEPNCQARLGLGLGVTRLFLEFSIVDGVLQSKGALLGILWEWYLGILITSGLPLTGDDDDDDDNDSDERTVLALKRSCVPPTSSSVHVQTGYQG